MKEDLLVSYRKMGDKTQITVQTNALYIPRRGEKIDFKDIDNTLKEWEVNKVWIVEEIKFQLPGTLYIDVYAQ